MQTSGDSSSVVFFGTGPVAAKSLELLLQHQLVELVITKPVPEGHRGKFPVHDIASSKHLPVLEVTSKKDLSKKLTKARPKSTLGVLIDFGIIVAKDVIDSFELGIINSHFSRLPEWRGADPITFAILSGQKSTAVSLMLLDECMDTGKILVQKAQNITPNDTTASLTNKLIHLSGELLEKYIPLYIEGSVKPRQQPHPQRATYSRKITKQDGDIDWEKPAKNIEREIRAFEGWPKSYSIIAGKNVVITASEISDYSGDPGQIIVKDKEIHVCCGSKSLQILKLKPAGKNEMTAEAFLAGHKSNLTKPAD